MRAILLGAGASKAAGYPLASELMSSIEREALTSGEKKLRKAWREWDQYRRSASGILQLLLSSQNPEVVLSVPDLCEAARDASDLWARRSTKDAFECGQLLDVQQVNQYWDSSQRAQLTEATTARARLLYCLHWYFALKHHQDAQADGRKRREYLHQLLTGFKPSDTVITLNWDTTVERTLAEQGRWNPITGYGFEHELNMKRAGDGSTPLPEQILRTSEITLLKLHGCFGWYRRHLSSGLYFGSSYFLDEFEFHYGGHRLPLVDPAEPLLGPPEAPVLTYPSFLKQFGGVEMQKVWSLADAAFRQADQVEVWGYSLPESDTAARALLNVLRGRLERKEVAVTVHDPDSQTRKRWETFLGDRAHIDNRKLE